jgi:hypothetical protein
MGRQRFTPEQIIAKLREVDVIVGRGGTAVEACRQIALERTGKWIVIPHVSIRGQQAERLMLLFEQAEAEERLADLKRKSQKLCSVLGNFRRTVKS